MKANKMMDQVNAEAFLLKVDMEGLSYAVKNHAPKYTGDIKFEKILTDWRNVQEKMKEYINELRRVYNIGIKWH